MKFRNLLSLRMLHANGAFGCPLVALYSRRLRPVDRSVGFVEPAVDCRLRLVFPPPHNKFVLRRCESLARYQPPTSEVSPGHT